MPFNYNSIPPEDRTRKQIQMHMDIYNRANDICMVHNPDEEDFLLFYNQALEPRPYVIPNKNRDIGFGKGNLELRRFLADKYVEKKGEQMINVISKADWDSKKGNYRQEERGMMEERLALRTNDPKLLDEISPQLFLGVVRRSTEEIGTGSVIPEKPVDQTLSKIAQSMERLGLGDKEFSQAHQVQAQEVSDEERKKADLLANIV